MIPQKQFLYFLLDTPTGKAYYRDSGGNLLTQVVTAGTDVSLPNAPGNWLDTELSFIRNTTYHGINRSYSTPMDLVRDVATMVRELFLLGVGTEVPLTMAVFKYNSQPVAGDPQYKLYYKGNLDLTNIDNTVLETTTVNLMEGGVTQLLKSYENTILQIPCDGSIAENQKVLCDGLLVPDIFYYQMTPVTDIKLIANILPATFVNNEGDNYGIVHGDPQFQTLGSYTDLINNTSTILYSVLPITIRLRGTVFVTATNPANPTTFKLFWTTDFAIGTLHTIVDFVQVSQLTRFDYDVTITLQAYEKLFLVFDMIFENGSIVAGNFSMAFDSKPKDSRVWAITLYDLFKLALRQICLLASTTSQPLNYEAASTLLSANLNLMITSGDALRASGDSTYQRFFSITQSNGILQTSFGPVIKITLKTIFECAETVLVAALGNGHNGTGETLYLETLASVYNSSAVSFSIGEVAGLKWKYAKDLGFSDFEIGYDPQTYDQKAGKYEYNTTLAMKAPIKAFQKKLSKISKIRWDSYGIERLRANIGAATSTTRNDSDSSVFGLNVDKTHYIFDYFNARFTSSIPDPDDANNTNLQFQQNTSAQQMQLPITDGEYFQPNLDQAIIVFSEIGYAVTEACNLSMNATINSVNKPPLAPTDTFRVRLWVNGVAIYDQTFPVTGVNTSVVINNNFSQALACSDCIYVTLETTATCEVNINTASLDIGTYVAMTAANIPVEPGTSQKLLSWGTILPTAKPYTVGTSVVQYGFQYFVFNSIVPNTNFSFGAGFLGYMSGAVGTFTIQVYVNGILQASQITMTGTVSRSQFSNSFAAFSRDYALGDIVFFSVSLVGAGMDVSIFSANMDLTSNYIKAYSLKRVQYEYLQGVPNIAKNGAGVIRTDIAGAPYNIEDVTPKVCYRAWRDYIMSCFLDHVTGDMIFQTLSKNQYLRRSFGGVEIVEASNEPVLGFNRLFYPIEIELKTNVPIGFAELLSQSINQHIHFTFMGNDFYFFPAPGGGLSQKPALNESQRWKGILSPLNNLAIFANTFSFQIPDMGPNSISYSVSSPIQWVPFTRDLPAKYHTASRNYFLFSEQTERWLNKDDYAQPVQIGDLLSLPFITRDLDPITYTVYKCNGTIYLGPTNLDTVATPAVSDPYVNWQKQVDTSGWERGLYYIVASYTGGDLVVSELLDVRPADEMWDTIYIEATSSFNTQGIVFDGATPQVLRKRIYGGYDNNFVQKYLGKFYIDQPQDITILNAIPYEVTTLYIGGRAGVPDYEARKVLRMLLLDGCTIDGEAFSLNEGADLEPVFNKGAPKKIQKVVIRPKNNLETIVVNSLGPDTDASIIVSVNPQSFGPNITNASGTTETDLIDIIVTA